MRRELSTAYSTARQCAQAYGSCFRERLTFVRCVPRPSSPRRHPPMQSRGINESPSDRRTNSVADRRHFDPSGATTAELYRCDLSDHHRSRRTLRQRQLASAINRARTKSLLTDRASTGSTHEYDSPAMARGFRCCGHCIACNRGVVFLPKEKAIREAADRKSVV